MGRWASDVYQVYCRVCEGRLLHISQLMATADTTQLIGRGGKVFSAMAGVNVGSETCWTPAMSRSRRLRAEHGHALLRRKRAGVAVAKPRTTQSSTTRTTRTTPTPSRACPRATVARARAVHRHDRDVDERRLSSSSSSHRRLAVANASVTDVLAAEVTDRRTTTCSAARGRVAATYTWRKDPRGPEGLARRCSEWRERVREAVCGLCGVRTQARGARIYARPCRKDSR